jgi:L-malate glycosyltransferase
VARVLHVASGDLWAGAEVQIFNLLCELRRRGDVEPAALLLNEGELARRLRVAGVQVWVESERELGFFALAGRVIARARDFRATVIHSHRLKENLLASLAALACRDAAAMRTVHGITEYAAPWYRPDRRLLRWLDGFSARHIHRRVVVVSRQLLDQAAADRRAGRTVYITNGVDAEGTRRAAASHPGIPRTPGAFTVCFAGRLVPVKRVDLLIETAALLEHRSPGAFRFLIAGDGPLLGELRTQAEAAGVSSCCHFLGFRGDVLSVIAQADALLLTSDREGMPMVVLEALALGVPVVSHAVGAVVDIILQPALGRLVATQEPQAYARALQELRAASKGGLPHGCLLPEDYSVKSSADQYARLYLDLDSKDRVPL